MLINTGTSVTSAFTKDGNVGVSAEFARRHWALCLVTLAIASIMLRSLYFGDPTIGVDEEFYLLTGDRLIHGALPYVDIWDRKPIGIFIIFAAIRLLGGNGVVEYQIVAALFAAATATLIAMMSRRIATAPASLVVGLLYCPALAMSGGQGGQSPVFYNLPVAFAAYLILDLIAEERPALAWRQSSTITAWSSGISRWSKLEGGAPSARIRLRGAIAMLLIGIAMQIKYSALFEGIYFGLVLLSVSRKTKPRVNLQILDGSLWIACALLPTAVAWGWFIVKGHGDAFFYANFISIFQRDHARHQYTNLLHDTIRLLPFVVTLITGEWLLQPWMRSDEGPVAPGTRHFLFGWLAAAVIGFLIFGDYFTHYTLPLLPPLAIACARSLTARYRHAGVVFATLMLLICFICYPIQARNRALQTGNALDTDRLAAFIAPLLHGQCLYVFYGEPILYHLTGSCLPTRWAFPFHLDLAREAPALGVNPMIEEKRILASKPPIIVDRRTDDEDINFAIQALVRVELARNYHIIYSERHAGKHPNVDLVYGRFR